MHPGLITPFAGVREHFLCACVHAHTLSHLLLRTGRRGGRGVDRGSGRVRVRRSTGNDSESSDDGVLEIQPAGEPPAAAGAAAAAAGISPGRKQAKQNQMQQEQQEEQGAATHLVSGVAGGWDGRAHVDGGRVDAELHLHALCGHGLCCARAFSVFLLVLYRGLGCCVHARVCVHIQRRRVHVRVCAHVQRC